MLAALPGGPGLPTFGWSSVLTHPEPAVLPLVGILLVGALYGVGVARLRRRGDDWPAGRTTAFLAGGLGIVAVALAVTHGTVAGHTTAVSAPAAQIVSITAAPVPAIFFRDRKVTLEELRAQLQDSPPGQRTLIVKADRNTPYDLAVQIMNEGLKLSFSVVLAANPDRP